MNTAATLPPLPWKRRSNRSVLPGFGLTLGFTLAYLSAIVLIPLAALLLRAAGLGLGDIWRIVSSERVLNALWLSFAGALGATAINAVLGVVLAWVFVRYEFPGRRLFHAMIDLPFALPTAVAGIALTTVYAANGWLGAPLEAIGIKVAYTPLGVILAMTFVSLPFVVRTLEPVLAEIDAHMEEAAATLGASRRQTITRVILPLLTPALLTGSALAFARAVGEFGSVIFIAGNIPNVSEIAPLLIFIRLEEFDYNGAAVVATAMLAISFVLLLAINLLQHWSRRHAH